MTHLIDRIARKLDAGERLSEADALALYESPELVAIGELADMINRDKNDDVVFYNVNRHINPTNICALSCKFCAYSRKPGEEGGYAYSIDEMIAKAGEAVAQGATEVHMVGGLHPRWKYDHYRDMIAAIKKTYPDLHLKAFTAVELDWLARKSRQTIPQVLEDLRSVGLGSLPGGGAEIFHPEIRDAICDTKVSAEQWLDTHRSAHALGMASNCTMLYGHIERYEHRVDHMRRLRELQDETRGFNAFIPLSFQPFQNEMGIDKYTFGYDDLKTIAIARLFLDNFRHLKAYWIMLGQDVAQLALQFGANDLDGTIIEEKISRMAGGRAGMAMSRPFIENLIRKAGRTPCERDTLYNPVRRPTDAVPAVAEGKRAGATFAGSLELPEAFARVAREPDPTLDEMLALAREASLHELGQLAQGKAGFGDAPRVASCAPTVTLSRGSYATPGEAVAYVTAAMTASQERHKLEPQTITFDLATDGEHAEAADLGLLIEALFAVRHSFPAAHLAVAGIKGLWRLAQDGHADIGEVLQRLSESGVDWVEGSPAETETDLTHGEARELHRRVHEADIGSIARVELAAPAAGFGEPMWESFLKRVLALVELHDQTGGLLGISVEVSPGSFVSAVEYMRAVALVRIASERVPLVIAPLASIPTVSPAKGLGTKQAQHPAEKIAATALHFGASDLGPIDGEKLNPLAILQQIRAAGFAPRLRDGRLDEAPTASMLHSQIDGIRHVPGLSPGA